MYEIIYPTLEVIYILIRITVIYHIFGIQYSLIGRELNKFFSEYLKTLKN